MRSLLFALLDRWLAPSPDPRRIAWLDQWAYAHRGLFGPGVPENSPAAFAAAISRRRGIECDTQNSRDGIAMVFHDDGLERLTAESGPLGQRTAAELDTIRLRGGNDHVPSLREVLDQVSGAVPLLIELKSRGNVSAGTQCAPVRHALAGYRGRHAIMSFDPRLVRWFADHAPQTVRGLVVTEEHARTLRGQLQRRLALWHARPEFLAYDINDLPSRFAAVQRRRGLPILTWTVRSAEQQRRAMLHADARIAEGSAIA